MPCIQVSPQGEALAANGTSAGVVKVADTTKYAARAYAWLSDNAGLNQQVQITSITDATHMVVKAVNDHGSNVNTLNYQAGADVSTFLTANAARIDMGVQVVLQ